MEAEDPRSIEDRIRARSSRRSTTCSVCSWLANRDDGEFWDRMMRLPKEEAQHVAIYEEMAALGFPRGYKTIESHRKQGHRASD